ncbi:MAG: hypothetical protein MK098_06890 [Marinovum sp.]|nr:hypothetical protein [Marinovum sp.]
MTDPWRDRPYRKSQWFWATNLSGALGAMGTTGYLLLSAGASGADWPEMALTFVSLQILAIPIGILLAWVFVAPTLSRMMRTSISRARAALWGGGIGVALVGISTAFGRWRGWQQSRDDTFHSQIGGGDYIRSIDGILTPYGWYVLMMNSLAFIIVCVVSALLVQKFIGSGHSSDAH